MRILVVEDEAALSSALAELLRREYYAVDSAADGTTAEELVSVNSYDLIVLDWTIPAPNGIELLRRWRGSGNQTPVLMLTARSGIDDRVDGLDTGADDFLAKPFSLAEFLARVRSLLRRGTRSLQSELSAADLAMDRAAHRVSLAGRPLDLSPKEFALLEYLLTRRDQVVSRAEISDHVWDDTFESFANVVDVTIHRLRKKIDGERPDRLLQTVKGVGYVLRGERRPIPGNEG